MTADDDDSKTFRSERIAPLARVIEQLAWLGDYLKSCGMRLNKGSALEVALRSATELQHLLGEAPLATPAVVELSRTVMSMSILARAIHRGRRALDSQFRKRLSSYGPQDVALMRPALQSQERDMMFELIIASRCAEFAEYVFFAEPQDVTFGYDDRRWGASCKVVYSRRRDALPNAIVRAADQIQSSSVECGVAVINVTELIDHNEFYASWFGEGPDFSSETSVRPSQLLYRRVKKVIDDLDRHSLQRRLVGPSHGRSRSKTPLILFFAQSVAPVNGNAFGITAGAWYEVRSLTQAEAELKEAFEAADRAFYNHQF